MSKRLFVFDLYRGQPIACLGQIILKISVVCFQPQSCKESLAFRVNSFIPGSLQRRIEVCRTADILICVDAVIPICLIKHTGALSEAGIKLTFVLKEMGKPVILRPVLRDSFLHAFRHGDFVVKRNDLLGTLNDPCQNAFTGVLVKVLAIVLDVAVALNLGIEG